MGMEDNIDGGMLRGGGPGKIPEGGRAQTAGQEGFGQQGEVG